MFIFNRLNRRPAAVPALAVVLALTAAPVGAGAVELAAAAGAPFAADRGQEQEYACTDLATAHPDPRWDGVPLTIVAAPGESTFFGDVRATVTDETGTVLFDAFCQAPVLTAGLPSGER
jgi:hypothetical protein